MAPRGYCWDDLPNKFYGKTHVPAPILPDPSTQQQSAPQKTAEPLGLLDDLEAVGRRAGFGLICGGLTGAAFGFVDILRDPKTFAMKKQESTQKVWRFTSRFALFFGGYHAMRKVQRLAMPLQSGEENVLVAGVVTLAPLAVLPQMRPMLPYAIMMIVLDAVNGLNDV